MAEKNKAVFLDRDGVIVKEVGYIGSCERVEFIAGVFEALKALQDAGYLLIVISNQSGVARGLFEIDDVFKVNDFISTKLKQQGIVLSGVYFCPHHPEIGEPPFNRECDCRKPKPGMLNRAISEWNIDPAASWMVGDRTSDIKAGDAAGVRGILVGEPHDEVCESPRLSDLLDATSIILENC